MHTSRIGILSAFLFLLSGCASQTVSLPENFDASKTLAQLQSRLSRAAGPADVDVLAANHYAIAEKAYREARAEYADGASKSDVREKLEDGFTALDYAESRAAVARKALADVRSARQLAVDADAGAHQREELARIDRSYLTLAEAIEEGEDSIDAKEEARLISKYKQVAVQSAGVVHLSGPREKLNLAKSEDAQTWAPRSFAEAEAAVHELEKRIRQNPIDPRLQEASEHAVSVTESLLATERQVKQVAAEHPELARTDIETDLRRRAQQAGVAPAEPEASTNEP